MLTCDRILIVTRLQTWLVVGGISQNANTGALPIDDPASTMIHQWRVQVQVDSFAAWVEIRGIVCVGGGGACVYYTLHLLFRTLRRYRGRTDRMDVVLAALCTTRCPLFTRPFMDLCGRGPAPLIWVWEREYVHRRLVHTLQLQGILALKQHVMDKKVSTTLSLH